MRILFVNHTAIVSGAERSLVDLMTGLESDNIAHLACPEGDLARWARALGIAVHPIRGTSGSFRLHPLHTPASLIQVTMSAVQVARLARRLDVDIVHANSVRAGLMASCIRGRPAVAVHVRDCLPRSRAAAAIRRVILRRAAVVIANSRYTASTLSADPDVDGIVTIHNAVDVARFDPDRIGREAARARLGLPVDSEVMGVVAQITPWKAQDDAIRVLHLLRERRPTLHLLIIGGVKFAGATRYDNEGYLRFLLRLVNDLDVGSAATFLGDREDVPEILAALDVLLVPSWEEPFGRSVVEAMAMGLPVVATSVGGPREVITHGDDGVLLAPCQPAAWAATVDHLLAQPRERAMMGHQARQTAVTRFSLTAETTQVTAVYRTLVAAGRPISASPA